VQVLVKLQAKIHLSMGVTLKKQQAIAAHQETNSTASKVRLE
jgi:hypothetical protein